MATLEELEKIPIKWIVNYYICEVCKKLINNSIKGEIGILPQDSEEILCVCFKCKISQDEIKYKKEAEERYEKLKSYIMNASIDRKH